MTRERLIVTLFVAFTIGILLGVSMCTPPQSWLPTIDEAASLLGTLLPAQAAIAALTLAVTIFVLGRASERRESDDRVYSEYIKRSSVRLVFWMSTLALLTTGVILLAMNYIGADTALAHHTPGLRNLSPVAALAFLGNLTLPILLLERAIVLARPQHWTSMLREVYEREVRDGVQSYVARHGEQSASRWHGWRRRFHLIPDIGEGSANEGIRALLGEASKAMADRQNREFSASIESVKQLLEFAMDEMEKTDIQPGEPGTQPAWPPARELSANLFSLRDEVISQPDQYFINALLGLDYWFIANGVRRRFGDLFTLGLAGLLTNEDIASRVGSADLKDRLSDQLGIFMQASFRQLDLSQAYPYLQETIRHQERRLHGTIHADSPEDYASLCNEVDSLIRAVSRTWATGAQFAATTSEALVRPERDYRISLLGLGGHAVQLAEAGSILDPQPYLAAIRSKYLHPQLLADDVAYALQLESGWGLRVWTQWETEGMPSGVARFLHPEMYPLTALSIRLLELCGQPVENLDLHGRAQQVLNWFTANLERLQGYALTSPLPTIEERREIALAALTAAVLKDEVTEDYEIINLSLSEDRIAGFVSGMHQAASATNGIERFFDNAGALELLPSNTSNGPKPRYIHRLEPKGFLSDQPETMHTYYAPLEGDQYGEGLSHDTARRLREALDYVQPAFASLNSPESLLQTIDQAIESLSSPKQIVILLEGDWASIVIALGSKEYDGYTPAWQTEDIDEAHGVGLYRGNALVLSHSDERREMYIVVPGEWGKFVRGEVDPGLNIDVEVTAISPDRALELLAHDQEYFPNEHDIPSKLRKLQTCVEIRVGFRTEFRMVDPSRARRFVDTTEPVDSLEATT